MERAGAGCAEWVSRRAATVTHAEGADETEDGRGERRDETSGNEGETPLDGIGRRKAGGMSGRTPEPDVPATDHESRHRP